MYKELMEKHRHILEQIQPDSEVGMCVMDLLDVIEKRDTDNHLRAALERIKGYAQSAKGDTLQDGPWHDLIIAACEDSIALSGASEQSGVDRVIKEWIDGAPPDFEADKEVLIVAEIPSLFHNLTSHYKVFRWNNGSWGNKVWNNERYRALRWMRLPIQNTVKEETNSD